LSGIYTMYMYAPYEKEQLDIIALENSLTSCMINNG